MVERGKKLYFFTIIADILFGYCVLAGWIEITRLKANRDESMEEREKNVVSHAG